MEAKKIFIFSAVALAVVTLSALVVNAINAPRSYDDCILKNMKHAQTREAAYSISAACKREFPNPFDQFDGQVPGGR